MGFDEKVSETVREHERRKNGTPPNPQPLDEGRREVDVATMSKQNLVKTVAANPLRAAEVIKTRPTMVGELIQHSLQSGQPAASTTLMNGLKWAYRQGTGQERELLMRSVMRAHGPGASEVRDLMRTVVEQETHNDVAPPKVPGVTPAKILDPRLAALDAADRDPAGARFRANFFDRPEESAAQLLDEAKTDPAAFQRHAAGLADLVANGREQAVQLADAVLAAKGPHARNVKLHVLGALQQNVRANMYSMDRHINDLANDGGPKARAERLVPTIARLMSDPETARALVQAARLKRRVPGGANSLHSGLDVVFDRRWSGATRTAVQDAVAGGAADLYHDALTGRPEQRRARTMDASRFFGESMCAESENEKLSTKESFAHLAADVLELIADKAKLDTVPGAGDAAKLAAKKTGQFLREDNRPNQQLTADSSEDLMRKIYDQYNGLPTQAGESAAYDDYVVWSADARNELDIVGKCGK